MTNGESSQPPGFWKTVRLLLGATRKRSRGRRTRQQQLLNQRKATDWGVLGFLLSVLMMAILNGFAAFVVMGAVDSGERLEAEHRGKMVVSNWFLRRVSQWKMDKVRYPKLKPQLSEEVCSSEAKMITREYGGTPAEVGEKLCKTAREQGTDGFISSHDAAPGMKGLPSGGVLPAMLGSLVLAWWWVMLVCQGEGLEMDLQRRRHPMWEWLFSHPVPAGAVFFAEMLSPIAANPIYWSAPLFVGIVYGTVYGAGLGMLAAVGIGIPVSVAAACLGKALEIGVILRFSPRSRGAMVGLMGWVGYASMMLFFVGWFVVPKVLFALGRFLGVITMIPWPWLGWFLGQQGDGSLSFLAGLAACWMAAGVTGAGAVWFSVWGAQRGLAGNFGQATSGPAKKRPGAKFGREPLYRKEFLWFTRDRSALVQAILIPLTVAGYQLFNLRGILNDVQGSWNYLSGAAILFGTYFLWVLGPRSLASEGSALWMALTWPRGLESLLKAKAWLWSMISTAMVAVVLAYAGYLFPNSIWKIGLVGVGWFLFARSMAEKSVTLVTVTSESGEAQKVPAGRRWAAQLGMLTFSIGVLMQQWHLAVIGIVYSYITSAAMWENFRARLPYLYDPWSEKLPPPPTLMHAMIAVSILVDAGAVLTGMLAFMLGRENIALAQAISYALCAVGVSIGTAWFLNERGVSGRDVWRWPTANEGSERKQPWWRGAVAGNGKLALLLLVAAGCGLALGVFAHGYRAVLEHIPGIAEVIRKSQEQMEEMFGARVFLGIMAVGFAPFAEEYLFRGLLFRALDREWGGWRAVAGSAAFFCIYHPPLAWIPVGLLGAANALIFKKTGRLLPAVLLHVVYNAAVIW